MHIPTVVLATQIKRKNFEKDYKRLPANEVKELYDITTDQLYALLNHWEIPRNHPITTRKKRKAKATSTALTVVPALPPHTPTLPILPPGSTGRRLATAEGKSFINGMIFALTVVRDGELG